MLEPYEDALKVKLPDLLRPSRAVDHQIEI